MKDKYILAIDQGTTSTRAILYDKFGKMVNYAFEEITQSYPQLGYVEQNPLEIYSKTLSVLIEVLTSQNKSLDDVAAIGITNQRETVVIFDKKTKQPVYPAIVWQSNQSKEICDKLIQDGYDAIIKEKTGLLINPYFSASKVKWIFDNYPDIKKRAFNNELLLGTIDTWLLYKLTNGKVHATDYSNASRTMLFNIHTLKWDDVLLKIFGIPKSMLPEVKDSSGVFGYLDESIFMQKTKIPISGIAGDQQAALFGQGCFSKGDIKNTYGTGCFALINTGSNCIDSQDGLLTTIAYKINDEVCYALEGSVFVGGAAVQWLRDELRLIRKSSDSEYYAKKINSSDGVYVVPSFNGLGTPYWDSKVKGAIFGMTRATSKEHLIRATLEAIAYQSKDVIETMKKNTKLKLKSIVCDGGASENDFLMQFQSDILNCKIILPESAQSTALGVAYLAGLAVGYYENIQYLERLRTIKKEYTPKMNKDQVSKMYKGWKKAIKATKTFKL